MEEHAHAAHEVGAAEDTHGHYAVEIQGAVHQADFDRLVARVRQLDDSVQELQRRLRAEQEITRALRGAMTAGQMVAALRARADAILAEAGEVLAPGLGARELTPVALLARELHLLANEIGG